MKQNLENSHPAEEGMAVVAQALPQVVPMPHLVLPSHLHVFPQVVQYFQLTHSRLVLHQRPALYVQGTNVP